MDYYLSGTDITIDDIKRLQNKRNVKTGDIQWDARYLPIVVGVVGAIALLTYRNIKRKGKK